MFFLCQCGQRETLIKPVGVSSEAGAFFYGWQPLGSWGWKT